MMLLAAYLLLTAIPAVPARAAVLLVVLATAIVCRKKPEMLSHRQWLLGAGVAALATLIAVSPLSWSQGGAFALEGLGLVFLLAYTGHRAVFERVAEAVVVVAAAAVAAFSLQWGKGTVDVQATLGLAAGNIVHGHSPYTGTFPAYIQLTARELDPVPQHFPYGPTAAVLSVPGYVAGDVRLLELVGFVVIALCLVLIARRYGVAAQGPLLLFVASPWIMYLLKVSSVDVYMVVALAMWVIVFKRSNALAMAVLAAALAVKLTLAVPLVVIALSSRRAAVQVAGGAVGAGLISLAFALPIGVHAYYADTVGLYASMPPYLYTATFASVWEELVGSFFPAYVWAAASLGAVYAVVSQKITWTTSWQRSAFVTLVFTLFGKWAFPNYYFLPASLVLIALLVGPAREAGNRDESLPEFAPAR